MFAGQERKEASNKRWRAKRKGYDSIGLAEDGDEMDHMAVTFQNLQIRTVDEIFGHRNFCLHSLPISSKFLGFPLGFLLYRFHSLCHDGARPHHHPLSAEPWSES